MNVFRIAKSNYIQDLSGEGARIYGGRWNRPGVAVLYTSQARSLAMLELIVHFSALNAMKEQYSFLSLSIPNEFIETIDLNLLRNIQFGLNNNKLWEITEDYFFRKNILALKVPSILIPEEFNVLLNPQHPNYQLIKKISIMEIDIDDRFRKFF